MKTTFIDYRSDEYNKKMKSYIADLEKSMINDPDAATKARNSLISSGVADKSGHIKEKIVSWE